MEQVVWGKVHQLWCRTQDTQAVVYIKYLFQNADFPPLFPFEFLAQEMPKDFPPQALQQLATFTIDAFFVW
jgi:hypothetical protein